MNAPRPFSHVVQISFFNDGQGRSPAQLLDAWPTLVDVAEAVGRSGLRISVVQASCHGARLERNGVQYHFLPFGEAPATQADRQAFTELLHRLAPDVFHVQGLSFPRHVTTLTAQMPDTPIVLQDHADHLPPLWRRRSWRRGLAHASGVAFCALAQARRFQKAGLLSSNLPLYEIPESTSRFIPGDRHEARRATQLTGEPAVLWVGHLDDNKDPLTVLAGIRAAVPALPGLQLYCCYGTGRLLPEVRARVNGDPVLRDRVHLLGRVPHERIQQLMQAADVFVLGSHREGSGYSLIEALACGLTPVVTDIPSFRMLTGGGTVGRLWPCGDAQALCQALVSIASQPDRASRVTVRGHFERELSLNAVGSKLRAMYTDVIKRAKLRELPSRQPAQDGATSPS